MTELHSNGMFYTDNGMEMKSRQYFSSEPIEANYYPMINTAYIQDAKKMLQFTVLTRQSMGVTSLVDGSLELMLQRFISNSESDGQDPTDNQVQIVTWNLLQGIADSQR